MPITNNERILIDQALAQLIAAKDPESPEYCKHVDIAVNFLRYFAPELAAENKELRIVVDAQEDSIAGLAAELHNIQRDNDVLAIGRDKYIAEIERLRTFARKNFADMLDWVDDEHASRDVWLQRCKAERQRAEVAESALEEACSIEGSLRYRVDPKLLLSNAAAELAKEKE